MTLLCATPVLLLALSSPIGQEGPPFLASQTEEGAWRGDRTAGDVGTTALVTVALLGSGNSTSVGPEAERLRRAIAYLLRKDGSQLPDVEAAWRAFALCEAALLDPTAFRDTSPQKAAIEDLLSRRNEQGSFDSPRVMGWAAFAVATAEDLSLELPADSLEKLGQGLARAEEEQGSAVASARCCLVSRWLESSSPAADRAVILALEQESLLAGLSPEDRVIVTLAAYQIGEETWQRARKQLRPMAEDKASTSAPKAGAALRAEAFRMLELQAYFRYARIQGAR